MQFLCFSISQVSAETLVRRGGITNHHSIAYYFCNISAKNYHNWLMCVKVLVCNTSVVFLDTVYIKVENIVERHARMIVINP